MFDQTALIVLRVLLSPLIRDPPHVHFGIVPSASVMFYNLNSCDFIEATFVVSGSQSL